MVYNAETTAKNAESVSTNDPGYCLQWCRQRAGIGSMYGDAATAWRNTNDRYPGDRNPPRGSMVYWSGGSHGYGHIAVSVGGGKVRSTDAGGKGRVATVGIDWPTNNWGLPYAGWAWDVNEVTIPHSTSGGGGGGGDDDMPTYIHAQSTAAKALSPDTWAEFPWDKVIADPDDVVNQGSPGLLIGGKVYQAVLNLRMSVSSGTVAVRTVEGYFKDGDWTVDEENRPSELPSSSGDDWIQQTWIGSVSSDHRLRFQVKSETGGTLKNADLTLLYW
jgi:hypothetical protein